MSQNQLFPKPSERSANAFGTFGGVFTPSILTILGVVMFMRTGFVTGQAGIYAAIAILLISKFITFLTGLSISAISTNTRVEGGGAYYLISRSLGPEFGASIGLALFLAQALSVPFYILGFVEALTTTAPELNSYFTALGILITALLFILNYFGSEWAIRVQYFILVVLALSILSFLVGGIANFEVATFKANLDTGYSGPNYSFWTVFAVFFPAVTGIMAGVNMSGDLKEPERSIPKGTLWAIGVGAAIYLIQILIMGGSATRASLTDRPYETLLDSAIFNLPYLVVAGVFAATLSSAIGSMMGAPRILQALARDNIFPGIGIFAHGTQDNDEPRRGLWLTLVMTVLVLAFASSDSEGGALNSVASVLTMFFLFTYGMTNVAAFVEHLSRNPSFRPRFKYFHWSTALLGGLGCFAAAFLINWLAALGALAMIVVIFFYISRRVLETTFGDARRGFTYERLRVGMLRLANQEAHPKNWRPTTLVLSGSPNSRLTLSTYAGWLASGSGIVTLANIIEGDIHENLEKRRELLTELDKYIQDNNLQAFAEVQVSSTFDEGLSALLQAHSIGPIKPNTLLLGWSDSDVRAPKLTRALRLAQELQMSQVILSDRGLPLTIHRHRRIDVWWRGRKNGSLMAILAHLLIGNWHWRQAKIRLLHLASDNEDIEEVRSQMETLINEARLNATATLVQGMSFEAAIHKHSQNADVVFLGFEAPRSDANIEIFHNFYKNLLQKLPTTLLISSSGEADLLH